MAELLLGWTPLLFFLFDWLVIDGLVNPLLLSPFHNGLDVLALPFVLATGARTLPAPVVFGYKLPKFDPEADGNILPFVDFLLC